MTQLIVAAIAFAATHIVLSASPIRPAIVGAIGTNPFRGLYSLVAFATLGYLIYAYVNVGHADFVWLPGPVGQLTAKVLMLPALVLLAMGATARNPTSMMYVSAINDDLPGIVKITRHPVQWAIMLWAVAHIAANGDVASLAFFGGLLVISAVGTVSMDARNRARADEAWVSFHARTSNVPFAALLGGRTRLSLGDVGWPGAIAGIVIYGVVFWFHDWIAGVPLIF
jgi:uncharacterized membrane protein